MNFIELIVAVLVTYGIMGFLRWRFARRSGETPPSSSTEILQNESLLELWKYFENQGASTKVTMLSVLSWVTALLAAVFGFALKHALGAGDATEPILGLAASLVGLGLVFYADLLLWDFGFHIEQSFHRADLARAGDRDLDAILEPRAGATELPQICQRLRYAISAFCLGFAYLAIVIASPW